MQLKIFYVDDEPCLLEIFKDYFESPQIEIQTFSDPWVAIEAIKTSCPDCIFLDYRMPNMNGDELALALDENLPKYLITGDLFVQTKARFIEVFGKPIDYTAVQKAIHGQLSCKLPNQ